MSQPLPLMELYDLSVVSFNWKGGIGYVEFSRMFAVIVTWEIYLNSISSQEAGWIK